MNDSRDRDLIQKNARTGLTVLAVVAFMMGAAFASAPLYALFCRLTGFAGTPKISESLPDQVLERTVTIGLNADTALNFPWTFKPDQREVSARVGAQALVSFTAHNNASISVTGTALYNVTPLKAGKYLHKIQCFCFDKQTLAPGETISMPVLFYIDPTMNNDPNMEDVSAITLSYTFFPADSNALEEALEAFYNEDTK
ncbi:MAG: cytochrome c oxidase assembly protein [Alphaproteobacteria bacterium]|nr:cytochrome c oxidase assembly protein [Alphaproteobacteria bacterium]